MIGLSSKDKAALRGAAQRLKPALHIGRHGVTVSAVAELEQAFRKSELVKVAFNADRETIPGLAKELEEATRSVCVGGVGKRRSYFKRQERD